MLGYFCLFYEQDDSCLYHTFQENKSFSDRVSINFTFKMTAQQENTV